MAMAASTPRVCTWFSPYGSRQRGTRSHASASGVSPHRWVRMMTSRRRCSKPTARSYAVAALSPANTFAVLNSRRSHSGLARAALAGAEPVPRGDQGRFCAVVGLKLPEDCADVVAHRLVGDPQSLGDLAVR